MKSDFDKFRNSDIYSKIPNNEDYDPELKADLSSCINKILDKLEEAEIKYIRAKSVFIQAMSHATSQGQIEWAKNWTNYFDTAINSKVTEDEGTFR